MQDREWVMVKGRGNAIYFMSLLAVPQSSAPHSGTGQRLAFVEFQNFPLIFHGSEP